MKKSNLVKRNMKTLGALMMVATMAVGMTACGGKEDDNTTLVTFEPAPTESSQEVEGTPETNPIGEEASFIGQITAIEDNTIVLVKGEQPPMPEGGEQPIKPEGGEQPIRPEGGEEPTDKPDGGQMIENPEIGGEAPEMPADFTGETMTITITEDTSIIVNGEKATVAELAVDNIVSVVMDGDSVNSITVGFGL